MISYNDTMAIYFISYHLNNNTSVLSSLLWLYYIFYVHYNIPSSLLNMICQKSKLKQPQNANQTCSASGSIPPETRLAVVGSKPMQPDKYIVWSTIIAWLSHNQTAHSFKSWSLATSKSFTYLLNTKPPLHCETCLDACKYFNNRVANKWNAQNNRYSVLYLVQKRSPSLWVHLDTK